MSNHETVFHYFVLQSPATSALGAYLLTDHEFREVAEHWRDTLNANPQPGQSAQMFSGATELLNFVNQLEQEHEGDFQILYAGRGSFSWERVRIWAAEEQGNLPPQS